jgi:uncharacterized membrane protein
MSWLALLLALGAGLVGGVLFAFSSFVMKALGELPPRNGLAAMQRINVVVLNPGFLGLFVGTAVLSLAAIVVAWWAWDGARSAWLMSAAVLYLVGTFGVTAACNVPRNDRLARIDRASADAPAAWSTYRREWTRWNHVRTLASTASAACAIGALIA